MLFFKPKLFLTILMCLGVLSFSAFAEDLSEIREEVQINEALRSHSSSFRFAFIGAFFGRDPNIHFIVITPENEVIREKIRPNSITGPLRSSIKVSSLESGRYTLILKNKGSRTLLVIGGFVGVNSSHPIKSEAIKRELAAGEEVSFIFRRKTGFQPFAGKEHLLKWNPFDWL